MKNSTIPRSSIFFTTKVPPRAMGYEATKASIASSFAQTGLEYIDLYLIHSPYGGATARKGTWRALVEAQRAGLIRSIGVSNYGVHHLNELESYISGIEAAEGSGKGGVISVGQYELHPWLMRPDIVEWCRERDVVLEAYSPLVRGERFEEPTLKHLAEKYGRTPAQVLLRWSLQWGFVPLPKSVTLGRIEENADVFGFELGKEEMAELDTGEYSPCTWDPTVSND